MEGRGLTNLLLAIIAGVLLFGKDAISTGLQGVAIALIAIFAIYVVLVGIGALLSAILQSYRDAKDTNEVIQVTVGLFTTAVLMALIAYAGIMWLSGVERPIEAALDSWVGKLWIGLLLAGIASIAIYVARNAFFKLREKGHGWRFYLNLGVRYFGLWAVAPIAFPIREWKFKRADGSGVAASLLSSAYVAVLGLIVWSILFGFIMIILTGIGFIN